MDFKLIGLPCGQHGPYTFYKAFRYSKNGKTNILALSEFFFVKLWNDSDLVSIGELQLLWEDKNSEQTLASLRLYILPENTPEGRSDCHGEHEVLAITEKVVLRVEDLLTWITEAADWSWGLAATFNQKARLMPRPTLLSDNSTIDLSEVNKEKELLGESHWRTKSGVVVLSFPRYCRYRAIVKRLEGVQDKWLKEALVVALGGFSVPCRNTRVLFCKDTFDYPDLEGHELLCNHLAPKQKGRPRKKRRVMDVSNTSSDSESESSSVSTSSSSTKAKTLSPQRTAKTLSPQRTVSQVSYLATPRRTPQPRINSPERRKFFCQLHAFMRKRHSPINKVPTIGFKELNLFTLYSKVQQLGGYDTVCGSRLWKYVYEEIGGDQSSTSAATCCRRHYERLLLPFERHMTRSRSKNPTNAKLNSYQEISITTKSSTDNAKNLLVKINQSKPSVEKENIPQSMSNPPDIIDLTTEHTPVKSNSTEVIDLDSESDDPQSPVKSKLPVLSSTKKQKLEILKEGGLEVTAISAMTNGRSSSQEKPRPTVIQHLKLDAPMSGKGKVSITITPDVMSNTRHAHAWSHRSQSVYGNPKESVQAGVDEILDLRTRPVGSNLEITLVPQSSSVVQQRSKKPQMSVSTQPRQPVSSQRLHQPQHRSAHKPVLKVPSPSMHLTNGRGPNIVPNVSISLNQDKHKTKVPTISHNSQHLSVYKPECYSFMNPMYLSALYGSLPIFPSFSPSTTTGQRQNIPDSFPRLLQDGSTSISLVNQNPTSTSK